MPLPEKALIAQIRRMAQSSSHRRAHARIITAIGDDCAVVRVLSKFDTLLTTDFSLEGIHFRRDWHPAESIGHRCLARGLSDIAAMAGQPVAAFLSLATPPDLPQAWIDRFTRGFLTLAKRYGVTLAGGDTAESPHDILADIVVLGVVPRGKAIPRSGARPGDRIYVSGELGGSAAAVLALQTQEATALHPERVKAGMPHACPEPSRRVSPPLREVEISAEDLPRIKGIGKAQRTPVDSTKLRPPDYPRHFYPEPRIELARILRERNLATAMIDTSDGLSTDLTHICDESRVGARIAQDLIPRARVGKPASSADLDLALHGGEDYELLFTVPRGKHVPKQIAGVALTCIGEITRTRGMSIESEGVLSTLKPRGWEHFMRAKE